MVGEQYGPPGLSTSFARFIVGESHLGVVRPVPGDKGSLALGPIGNTINLLREAICIVVPARVRTSTAVKPVNDQ